MRNRVRALLLLAMMLLETIVVPTIVPAIMAAKAELKPAVSIWVDPRAVNLTTAAYNVGDKFNVTLWANTYQDANNFPIFTWQITMNFNASLLTATRVGYTNGSTSGFFTGHSTIPVAPIITSTSASTGESLVGTDSRAPGNGSLCWVEMQINQKPAGNATITGTLDINNTDTFMLDANLNEVTSTKYSAQYTFSAGPAAPLSVSISPPSASVAMNQTLLFISNVTGGTAPYGFQWFLDGSAVPGATSDSWTFLSATSGTRVVYLNVTDGMGVLTESNIATVTVSEALPVTPKQKAIRLGLAWLAKQQDSGTGAWSKDYYPVASTAFAVTKFATYKYETGDATYDGNVGAGLKYLLSSCSSFQVNIAADLIANPGHWTGPGTPASNGDGVGVYFMSTVGTSEGALATYETGVVMMALQAADESGYINRNALVPAGSDLAIANKTYYTVMGDMVNFYAWAQNDASSGTARGGWRYVPNSASSDNSVSQWPTLGLIAAENWTIFAPSYVKSELLNYWLAYSQNSNGGFGYSGSGSPYVPMTAAGLIELTYCDVPTTDPRWNAAESFIGTNWKSNNIGNMYAMYGVMKAAMTAQPNVVSNFTVHDWQREYDDYLVNVSQVKPDGYWPATGREEAPRAILATEWALLTLEKAAPPPPPPTSFMESLEDLLRRQAHGILGFEDLLELLPTPVRTSELLESLENLTKEQEDLLHSFEGMINVTSLPQAEFINLLNSTEDLLHTQYKIKERFMDILNETRPYLQPRPYSILLDSTEDLLRSDARLVEGFRALLVDLFNSPGVTMDQRIHFLESYEQLLESQSLLVGKFEELIKDPQADVAVTSIDVSPTTVLSGDSVNINVTVQDPGDFAETLNVTVYANSQVISVQPISLNNGSSTNLAFTWNTIGFAEGNYTVSASASIVPDEVNTANNNMLAGNMVTVLDPNHDVAVTDVTPYKTVIGQGNMNITVTAGNHGDRTENFNVTVYANTTEIETKEITLSSGTSLTLTFAWNTAGFAKGNYTISAYAWPVPGETNTADNTLTYGTVYVGIPGDINGDGKVNMRDVGYIAKRFGAIPGSPLWDPNADVNGDGKIDMKDSGLVALGFEQHYP